MNAYSLVQDICSNKFDFEITNEIGYGAQGQVFNIKEYPDRVIKISILYDVHLLEDIYSVFGMINQVYDFIIDFIPPSNVRVFEFGKLKSDSRFTVNGPQKYIIFYSIQEKLLSLSDDEKKVLKTICQAHNNELDSQRDIEDILKELQGWLSFDYDKVLSFSNSIDSGPINHNDVHRRNIMKDRSGNFKLIDFDLAKLK